MSYLDSDFKNADGLVEFPFTVNPETDSRLRLQFRHQVLSLNREYLTERGYERWLPEDFERLFQEFRILYLHEDFSPVEIGNRPEWVEAEERPPFGDWLEEVWEFDHFFHPRPTPIDQVDRNNWSIYEEFEIPDSSFAFKNNLPYNKRGYPFSDFCPKSKPIGRRIPRVGFKEDTTHLFTKPYPFTHPPCRTIWCSRTLTYREDPAYPTCEQIRRQNIEDDPNKVWNSSTGRYVLPDNRPSIAQYSCDPPYFGTRAVALLSSNPNFRYGQETTSAHLNSALSFIGYVTENILVHEILPRLSDKQPSERENRSIEIPRSCIEYDPHVERQYRIHEVFFGRSFLKY